MTFSPEMILLNCGKAIHNADWNFKNISSPFARIHRVISGEAYIIIGTNRYKILPNFIYLTPPFTLHSYECSGKLELSYIHFYDKKQHIFEELNFPVAISADPLDNELIERVIYLNPSFSLNEYDPKRYDTDLNLKLSLERRKEEDLHNIIATRSIINYLLSGFIKQSSPKHSSIDPRVRAMVEYIRENIYNTISIEELCEISNISPNHVIRIFKKEIGLTPIDYINKKKIELAQLLLTTEKESIKTIAYKLSFENISYFNRLFRRYTGTTPKILKQIT